MHQPKGFTLLELLITASILAMTAALLAMFTVTGLRSWGENQAQAEAQENARAALARMTKIIREATASENGAYAIATAAAQTLTFYANVDDDSSRERVRFFLDATDVKIGITQPTGQPATYPAGNESVSTLVTGIQNGANPLFLYYDTDYTGTQAALSEPVNVQDVRLVQLHLSIDADPAKPPAPIDLQTSTAFRNLKENL